MGWVCRKVLTRRIILALLLFAIVSPAILNFFLVILSVLPPRDSMFATVQTLEPDPNPSGYVWLEIRDFDPKTGQAHCAVSLSIYGSAWEEVTGKNMAAVNEEFERMSNDGEGAIEYLDNVRQEIRDTVQDREFVISWSLADGRRDMQVGEAVVPLESTRSLSAGSWWGPSWEPAFPNGMIPMTIPFLSHHQLFPMDSYEKLIRFEVRLDDGTFIPCQLKVGVGALVTDHTLLAQLRSSELPKQVFVRLLLSRRGVGFLFPVSILVILTTLTLFLMSILEKRDASDRDDAWPAVTGTCAIMFAFLPLRSILVPQYIEVLTLVDAWLGLLLTMLFAALTKRFIEMTLDRRKTRIESAT